jgi:hypothetical protein
LPPKKIEPGKKQNTIIALYRRTKGNNIARRQLGRLINAETSEGQDRRKLDGVLAVSGRALNPAAVQIDHPKN